MRAGKTVIYRDQLGGKYVASAGSQSTPAAPALGLPVATFAQADFDGDGRVDAVAVAKAGGVYFFHNETAQRSYLRVQLTGVKNAKLAPAAEVEIKAGLIYEKKMYTGVPLVFDLEDKPAADMVRITWANGLIQSEKNQAANRSARYEESQRLSGSCPMIWTWNGVGFEFITDVLGVAPLGASAGDGTYFPVDHTEYISIPSDALALQGGKYELRITEELAEVSYLDQVQLIAVDHPAGVDVYPNEKFQAPPYPDLKLYGVEKRIAPVSARDQHGRDVRDLVMHRDQRSSRHLPPHAGRNGRAVASRSGLRQRRSQQQGHSGAERLGGLGRRQHVPASVPGDQSGFDDAVPASERRTGPMEDRDRRHGHAGWQAKDDRRRPDRQVPFEIARSAHCHQPLCVLG